jgi:ribosomal-protein-alanine N-acetyltransferase
MEMDPDVRRYVGGHPRSREDAERKFPYRQLQEVSGQLGVWATVLKSNGQYIGRCGLFPHINSAGEMVVGEAALSFYIARQYWGQGLGSEAAVAFVEFGWKQLQLSRIVTTAQVENVASVRILEKLGFILTSTERGQRSFFKFALQSPESRNG